MAFTLDAVVPWGRDFDEYRAMFVLGDDDLSSTILGCADGPASFNAEATAYGARVTSCDPLYKFGASEIAARIDDVYPTMIAQTRAHADGFVWDRFESVEALGAARRAAMARFLADYQHARGRYVAGDAEDLPFADGAFDLALCSHFLFLYSDHLSHDFHRRAIREMCRVAREVRIFPLLALDRQLSPHVEPVVEETRATGARVKLERVPYEFQRGGHTMLRIRRT